MVTCTAGRHDTLSAYKNHGCRCPAARLIWSRYCKAYRLRRQEGKSLLVPAIGTQRRIRALMATGWRTADIAARLPSQPDPTTISQIAKNAKHVHVRTAKAFADLYGELGEQQGPSEKLRKMAARWGWLEPKWWDEDTIDDPLYRPPTVENARYDVDPVAVELACRGDRVALTFAERVIVTQRMTEQGRSAKEIGLAINMTARAASRYRGGHVGAKVA